MNQAIKKLIMQKLNSTQMSVQNRLNSVYANYSNQQLEYEDEKNQDNRLALQYIKTSLHSPSLPLCKKYLLPNPVFDKHTLQHVIGCVYVYENQQPGQVLKMLLQKFETSSRIPNLIFPSSHVKDNMQDKCVSLFFVTQHIAPLSLFTEKQYQAINVAQMLKFTYDAFCSLHYLHSHDVVHGNISLSTCYISRKQTDMDFVLNILDTSLFHQDIIKSNQALIFRSQSQQNGIKTSYKDDVESMMYILLHLISQGKMLSKQRYSTQWINEKQLLKWKNMEFFKEMVQILPPQLQFLTEIYTMIKSLSRHQKPDYHKIIKKTYSSLNENQNSHLKNILPFSSNKLVEPDYMPKTVEFQEKHPKNPPKSKHPQDIIIEEEQIQLLVMDSEDQENTLQSKFSKLQSTKCTLKTKRFWSQKVQSQE